MVKTICWQHPLNEVMNRSITSSSLPTITDKQIEGGDGGIDSGRGSLLGGNVSKSAVIWGDYCLLLAKSNALHLPNKNPAPL